MLYTFTLNQFYAYLLNVEQSKLVFLKTYNTEFDEIIITYMDQNRRLSEMEDLKTASKKLVNKEGEFIEYKFADTVIKSNDDKIVEQEPVEEIIISAEKRDELWNKLRKVP